MNCNIDIEWFEQSEVVHESCFYRLVNVASRKNILKVVEAL